MEFQKNHMVERENPAVPNGMKEKAMPSKTVKGHGYELYDRPDMSSLLQQQAYVCSPIYLAALTQSDSFSCSAPITGPSLLFHNQFSTSSPLR